MLDLLINWISFLIHMQFSLAGSHYCSSIRLTNHLRLTRAAGVDLICSGTFFCCFPCLCCSLFVPWRTFSIDMNRCQVTKINPLFLPKVTPKHWNQPTNYHWRINCAHVRKFRCAMLQVSHFVKHPHAGFIHCISIIQAKLFVQPELAEDDSWCSGTSGFHVFMDNIWQ